MKWDWRNFLLVKLHAKLDAVLDATVNAILDFFQLNRAIQGAMLAFLWVQFSMMTLTPTYLDSIQNVSIDLVRNQYGGFQL